MNGPNNWQGGLGNVGGHFTYGPSNGGYVGIGSNPPSQFPNWSVGTITNEPEQTSLEVFEELVGLIKLVELKLNLDHKDASKHKWLELVMGRIQEETINSTLKRLKALEL